MKEILKDIQNGSFAREWEKSLTKIKFKVLKFFATKQKINKLEREVRKNLKLNEFDIYQEDPPSMDEMEQLKTITGELDLFKQYYEES
jgi:hypothetical protein